MLILSSDPGLTGAVSLLCSQRGLLECDDIPTCSNGQTTGSMRNWVDVDALQTLLSSWSSRHEFAQHSVRAVIERPIPMPKLPSQTIAAQFDTVGVLRALIGRAVGPGGVHMVNPREWKKFFGLNGGKSEKDESIACALRLYPSASKWIYRKRDHNRSEAVLLGHFLMRQLA
jgi:hypothetical protein